MGDRRAPLLGGGRRHRSARSPGRSRPGATVLDATEPLPPRRSAGRSAGGRRAPFGSMPWSSSPPAPPACRRAWCTRIARCRALDGAATTLGLEAYAARYACSDALRPRPDLQLSIPVALRTAPLHHSTLQARPPPRARCDARRARDHVPVVRPHGLAAGAETRPPRAGRLGECSAARRHSPPPVERHSPLDRRARRVERLRDHRDRELARRNFARKRSRPRTASSASLGAARSRSATRPARLQKGAVRARRERPRLGRSPRSCAATSGATTSLRRSWRRAGSARATSVAGRARLALPPRTRARRDQQGGNQDLPRRR